MLLRLLHQIKPFMETFVCSNVARAVALKSNCSRSILRDQNVTRTAALKSNCQREFCELKMLLELQRLN